MQLVAYGAQDIYLTGNPQITFFKVVYRRHTNFSMESIRQTLNGTSTNVTTGNATCTISRNGDLVHKVYVMADSNDDGGTIDGTSGASNGSALIKEVELEIGGQRIDRQFQEWNEVWNELTTTDSKALALKSMQCEVGTGGIDAVEHVQIPLNFWFCRNPGLALPLIALQYHEVKIKFTWGDAGHSLSPEVWCDYIYLDTDERRRFAQVSHEYLIEQLQRETYTEGAGDKKLNFNHPVKELIWVNDHGNLEGVKYQLKLNGHDRFAEQPKEYFTLRQPFDYHTAVPHQNLPLAALESERGSGTSVQFTGHTADGIYEGKDSVSGDGQVTIAPGSIIFQGAGAPGFDSNYSGGFDIIIEPTDYSGSDKATHTSNLASLEGSDPTAALGLEVPVEGAKYRARVLADSSKVTVAGNKITFVIENNVSAAADEAHPELTGHTKALPMSMDGYFIKTNAQFPMNCKILESSSSSAAHAQARTSQMTKEINVYSFALKPEEHQPSGTCNFSRIDNAQLKVTGTDGGGRIYAVNYNVLRIMSGMGGLAYSN